MNNSKVQLALGIHNHQPIGNFEGVMESAFARCYSLFLATLEKHPTIRMAIHHSGCLLDWLEATHPEYIKQLARMTEKGQIEILGGGYYEPILPSIPFDDAVEQLELMSDWVKNRLGAKVRGIWLTERIWEPSLPLLLHQANIEYAIVDETHFQFAGIPKEKMIGYYVTERAGKTTCLFPIDKVLRYKIPFDSAKNNLAYLRAVARRSLNPVVTYADDGEKFGVWPETHEWVYEKGWLDDFFTQLENADDVTTILYSEVIDRERPTGRLYVPSASYHEMMEWSLPVESGIELSNLRQAATQSGNWDHLAPFVRGGFWDNFLAKYPEANRMHKRMLRASAKSKKALAKKPKDKKAQQARVHALRGQCNCAYWHGLFGGLYLNYLRDGVVTELYKAEKLADKTLGLPRMEVFDHDADGNDEVVVDTEHFLTVIKPSYGGCIYELVDRRTFHHLTDVLSRRREIYHEKLTAKEEKSEKPKSPHEKISVKEEGLDKLLFYDWFERYSALDHFLAPWTDAASFATSRFGELGDFVNQPFELVGVEQDQEFFKIRMMREGGIYPGGIKHPLRVEKEIRISSSQPEIQVVTTVVNLGNPVELWLAKQWNLSLLAGNAPDRWIEIGDEKRQMGESGIAEQLTELSLNDGWKNLKVGLRVSEPMELWHFPVETVSQSEEGFERTYQGTAFAFSRKFSLQNGESKTIKLTLTTGSV